MQNGAFHVLAETLHGITFADEVRHSFAENALRVVDFLEPRNLAHQVEAKRLNRENRVVEFA